MDKTSQKVTKDPKKVEQGKKSYETRMKRLKEQILEEHQRTTSCSACDLTPSTSSSTCDPTLSTSSHATRSNDTYVYGVYMLAVLAIVFVYFFAYNTSQAKNKKLVSEKKDQPPKRRHML